MFISFSLLHKSAIHFNKEPQLKMINFQIEILILTGKRISLWIELAILNKESHLKLRIQSRKILKCIKERRYSSINQLYVLYGWIININALLQSQGNILFEKIFRTMSAKINKKPKIKMPFNFSQKVKNLLAAIFSMSSSLKLLTELNRVFAQLRLDPTEHFRKHGAPRLVRFKGKHCNVRLKTCIFILSISIWALSEICNFLNYTIYNIHTLLHKKHLSIFILILTCYWLHKVDLF